MAAKVIALNSTDFSPLSSAMKDVGYTPLALSTYSFQEAIRPLAISKSLDQMANYPIEDGPMYLFTDACLDNGVQDCTKVCSNATAMFNGLSTFHNCASYGIIDKYQTEGNISTTMNDNRTNLEELGFSPAPEKPQILDGILNGLTACLNSYCKMDESKALLQKDPYSVFNRSDAFVDFGIDGTSSENLTTNYPLPFEFADAICALQPAELNPDIGGIGVFVSYWIQSSLAIVGSILVVWWGWGLYYCCFVVHSLRHGSRAGSNYARNIGAKYGNTHLPSVVAALSDFQKAQCFFMLAINIATQVNKRQGGFQPDSLQALYNNNALIKAISVSGYLPITFTLLTLHTVGMVSWYLLILSILTVIFSVVTSIESGAFAPSTADLNYLSSQSQVNGTSACGGRNLLVYCLHDTSASPYNSESAAYDELYNAPDADISGGYSAMSFCIVALVILILDQTGLIKKLRNTKTQTFFIRNFMNIRGFQLLFVILLWIPSSIATPMLSFSTFLTFSIFYIFLTSNLRYQPRRNWAGRYFNLWIVLVADMVLWALSLTYLNLFNLTQMSESGELYGTFSTIGFVMGFLLWFSSFYTLIVTSLRVRTMRRSRPKKLKLPSQYSPWRRKFEQIMAPIQGFFGPVIALFKSEAVTFRVRRFRRYMHNLDTDALNKKILDAAIALLYILFHALYMYWFVVYAQYMGQFITFVDRSNWTFGQVVAITVWAQPLCEFFHLELRGMTRGFQHRLMWPYKVVRQDEDVEHGQPRYVSPDSPQPSDPADGGNQPKRASKQAPSTTTQSLLESPAAMDKISLSKDSTYSIPLDGPEANPILDQGRSLEDGHQRTVSDISMDHGRYLESAHHHQRSVSEVSMEHGRALELESEQPSSYLRVAEVDGSEMHFLQRQGGWEEQEQEQDLEHGREAKEPEHEPQRWQIPESVLMKPSSDLGFE